MSRRKQHKPQHIQSDVLSLNEHIDDTSLSWEFHSAVDPHTPVCKECCAEFNAVSDLRQHQNDCPPCLPVLIVNENEDLLSRHSFPAASLSTSCWAELEHNNPSQERSNKSVEFMDSLGSKSTIENPGSTKSDQCSSSSKCKTDTVHCTLVSPAALPQSSCTLSQGEYSWTASNVLIENLESTKVAMSQFLHSDSHHSKTAISSLLQQLLTLQIQQIHQLQLIDQIRHQVLLYTSHRAETSEPMSLCTQDQSFLKSTCQLQTLSAHLSQQLAAAAAIAKCLSTQSASMTDFKQFANIQQSQTDRRDLLSSLEASRLSTSVHRQPKFHVLSRSKMSSLMFGNNSIVHKTSQSPQTSLATNETASASIQNINAVVEDLDALAVLAQHSLLEPKLSSEKSFFKRKCQLCSKVFGSDSSFQAHLWSHTGERPYKCNICGNRFTTRGNFKVHFQRHKDRYNYIPVTPRPVPEHEVQKVCQPMLPSSDKTNKSWDGNTLSPVTTTFPLEQFGSFIKKEEKPKSISIPLAAEELNFDSQASPNSESTVSPAKSLASTETKYQRSMKPKLRSEESEPDLNSSLLEVLHLSKDPQLQSLSEDTNRKVTGLNECIICHRILSCQSALRMHYRTHTGERPYQCKLCSRTFTTKGNLKTHQVVHHTAVPSLRAQHSCPICQRKFLNAVVLQEHIHMHIGTHSSNVFSSGNNGRFYKTFKCMSTFSSSSPSEKTNIGDHEKSNDNGILKWIKTERLEGANEEFCQNISQLEAIATQWNSSFPVLENQVSTSRLDRPVQTWFDPSSVTLSTPATTSSNMKIEDSQRQISSSREKGFFKNCDLCGKNFACQSALNIHYRSHTKERPFICTTCNRGFSTKGNLKQHMLTHQIREFLPSLFEASYPNQAQAPKMQMNPAFKPSVWNSRNHCSLSLSSSSGSLPPPRRMPKQHHCKTCGKSFSSSSALQIHERTHTGERPFVCTVCGRAFTTKGNLKVHMGTHMWNSAPSRRGRRLSVDRSSMGFGVHPMKLPEPSLKQTTLNSNTNVNHWDRNPEVLSPGLQTNSCGVQSGDK